MRYPANCHLPIRYYDHEHKILAICRSKQLGQEIAWAVPLSTLVNYEEKGSGEYEDKEVYRYGQADQTETWLRTKSTA